MSESPPALTCFGMLRKRQRCEGRNNRLSDALGHARPQTNAAHSGARKGADAPPPTRSKGSGWNAALFTTQR
eukprot:5126088-Pyramimonas_sp.AAC.1